MNTKRKSPKKTQSQRTEETQQLILLSACKIFGEKGYENTTLDDIATETALTISPIYHHFGNKLQLFSAVNERMEEQLLQWLTNFAQQNGTIDLQQGWNEFITLCKAPGFAQIVLIDAPHVLGRERWKSSKVVVKAYDILRTKIFPFISDAESAIEKIQAEKDQELIMRMLMAALAEAALMIGQDAQYNSSRIIDTLFILIKGNPPIFN